MVFDLPFVKELNTNMLVSGEMCIDVCTAICNVVEFIHLEKIEFGCKCM